MTESRRTRGRVETARRSDIQRAPVTTRRDVYTGDSAREASEKAIADAKRRQEEAGKMPFRFYMNRGDEKSFIILDDKPSFMRWEHEEWDERNRRMNYYGCIAEFDNCPACEALPNRSYLAMYLTIIDLTPYTTKNGDEIPFSKKLLVVKTHQHKIFHRWGEKGLLRGAEVDAFRDKKTDPRIGGVLDRVGNLDEDTLAEYIRTYEDRDGKEHTQDVEPYDYFDLFPETTAEQLEQIFGSSPAPGSTREAQRELEDNFDDGDDPINDPEPGHGQVVNRGRAASTADTGANTPTRRRR